MAGVYVASLPATETSADARAQRRTAIALWTLRIVLARAVAVLLALLIGVGLASRTRTS